MLRAAEVGVGGGLLERLEPWASAWQDGAQAAFVDGYLAETAARGASFLPRSREALERALDVWKLDKAVYELGYELNHRPGWVGIPLAVLLLSDAPAPAAPPLLPLPRRPLPILALVSA